jgi:hypothetical protein
MRRPKLSAELVISGAGLAVALLLPLLIEIGSNTQETAVLALAVVVIQGFAFWRMRRGRVRTIRLVQAMLRDRVRNHLQVIMFALPSSANKEELSQVLAAVQSISETLDRLSVESIRAWSDRYPGGVHAG